jgi:hypothetical protein
MAPPARIGRRGGTAGVARTIVVHAGTAPGVRGSAVNRQGMP